MAASSAPTPTSKHRGRRFESKCLGLVAAALVGAIPTASAWGESVVLSGTAPGLAGHEASIEAVELAGLSLPALGATPAAAAAIHSSATALIPLSDPPPPSRRRPPAAVAAKPKAAAATKLTVPEPTALVLGLTSTLVLGSLSWKRRLTHHPARA